MVGCWRGYLLERGADWHIAQLMPLPLTISCSSKIQIGFTSLVPAHPGSLGRAVKRVCVYLLTYLAIYDVTAVRLCRRGDGVVRAVRGPVPQAGLSAADRRSTAAGVQRRPTRQPRRRD